MRYPKEQIALENERKLLRWLKENERKLPLTLYQLSKELNWSFGAIRGTILRLEKQPQSIIIVRDIIDSESKRFKTKVAMKGKPSENKIEEEFDAIQKGTIDNRVNNSSKKIDVPLKDIVFFLKKLLKIDENVVLLANEIKDMNLLQKFLEFQFGLESQEKKQIETLIQTLEVV